jgi:hypothetical protein
METVREILERKLTVILAGGAAERRFKRTSPRARSAANTAHRQAGYAVAAATFGLAARLSGGACASGSPEAFAALAAGIVQTVDWGWRDSEPRRVAVICGALAALVETCTDWRQVIAQYRRVRTDAETLVETNWDLISHIAEMVADCGSLDHPDFELAVLEYAWGGAR